MPTIKVPKIKIPKVDIPETPFLPDTILIGDNPACDLVNRDIDITKNPTIIFHRRKEYVTCPNGITITGNTDNTVKETKPIRPIVYDASDPIPTEGTINFKRSTPDINFKQPEDDNKIEVVPCPPKNAPYRPGDWRNELRLERLVKYEKGAFEGSCNAVWEKVPFVDQYVPSASVVVSTALIASVAATTPVLLQLVKPLVKNIIKKLTKKKNKANQP